MTILVPGPVAISAILIFFALVAHFDLLALAVACDACLTAGGHGGLIMFCVCFFGETC